jgi:hypothetical protein
VSYLSEPRRSTHPRSIIENMQRLSLRGKPLLNPASRAVSSRASSVARNLYTNLPTTIYQTVVHAAYTARSPSRELPVRLFVILVNICHSCWTAPLLANLHITTLGHGYSSALHVDHTRMSSGFLPDIHSPTCFIVMNLSHVITEFSFGKHFPEITQPLDNSFEIAQDSTSSPFSMRPL